MLNISNGLGKGKDIAAATNSAAAIKAAGLNWGVESRQIRTWKLAAGVTVEVPLPDHRAVVRTDNDDVLGVVGKRFELLQNSDAFKWFDPIVEAGLATYETAGSFNGGRRVWILARLNREDAAIVPGADDRVRKYLLLTNSHDGSMAARIGFTPIRVVCRNTLAMAVRVKNATSQLLRFRHSKGLKDAMFAAREIIDTANADFEATAEQYRALASRGVNADDLKKYVSTIFANRKGEVSERVMEAVTHDFEHGAGNDAPGVKGTWWAAYNAVTQYLSHESGTKGEEARTNSLWYGESAKKNDKALQYAYNVIVQS